jgi:hypothetical protein
MMADSGSSLDDVYSTLRRADRLYAQLKESVSEWLQDDGFDIAAEHEDDGWYCFRFLRVPNPPADHAHYLREMLGALRSALDYLAWQLVLFSDSAPGKSTAFPIVRKEENWANTARARLAGVRPEYVSRIKEVQPFNDAQPDEHPLAFLDEANNRTKHRFLAKAAVNRFIGMIEVGWEPPRPANASLKIRPSDPEIREGAVIFSVHPEPRDWTITVRLREARAGTSFDLGIEGLTDFPDLPAAVRTVISRFNDVFTSA